MPSNPLPEQTATGKPLGSSVQTRENNMTPQQIVGLSVRLFSIWLVIFAFQFNGYLSTLSKQPGAEPIALQYWLVGFVVVIAILLWNFPMTVAHKLIPKTHYQNTLHIPAQEVVHVACIIFALWLFLVKLLPALAYYLPLLVYISREKHSIQNYDEFNFMRMAPIVIQFIVAMILTFNARSISKFLLSLDNKPSQE